MAYIGKMTGDYKVIEQVSKDKYIFACTKCGEEKIMFKTCFYRKPKCQKCGGRKNGVLFSYKGRIISAKELSKETGLSLDTVYKKGVRK